jgi:hypothetical protein
MENYKGLWIVNWIGLGIIIWLVFLLTYLVFTS